MAALIHLTKLYKLDVHSVRAAARIRSLHFLHGRKFSAHELLVSRSNNQCYRLQRNMLIPSRRSSTMATYSLDTNIVSYLLNGELWERAPYNLLRSKPALTLIVGEHGMEKAPDHDTELSKSITAYKWSLLHTKNVRLVVPPTVTLELASARQVSNQFCFMYVLYYGQKWYIVTYYRSPYVCTLLWTEMVHSGLYI